MFCSMKEEAAVLLINESITAHVNFFCSVTVKIF